MSEKKVRSEIENLHFRVSSGLKNIIGKDLITNDFVALFELIKNSFDAKSSRVDLIFNSSSDGTISEIYIVDNGKGMSYDDIVNKWLFVAYSAKKDGSEDIESKQTYAGNKGVGRFSCDRLGGRLELQTKARGMDYIEVLKVDWGEFEKDSKELFADVNVRSTRQSNFHLPKQIDSIDTGVVLKISNLREPHSWDREKFLKLKRHLAKLINPFGDDKRQFEVYLHCERELEQDKKAKAKELDDVENIQLVNGPVHNFIFETLKQKTTWLQVSLDNDGWLYSTLTDRGELLYEMREYVGKKYPQLLDSGFRCQLFYLNMAAKLTFNKRMGLSSREFGSLFLFRNGFRVFPIGENGDDYWRLDQRKQQGYARYLGTRDILGRIDIAGDEEKFKESTSRDQGLIETGASLQLNNCVIDKCLKRLEKYVVDVTWFDKLDKEHDTAQRLSLDENRSRIIELITELSDSSDIELLNYNKNLVSVLNEKSSFFESSIKNLLNIADKSENSELAELIVKAQKRFDDLKKAEQEAQKRAEEEAKARKQAENAALQEREKRNKAEAEAEKAQKAYNEEKKRNLFLSSIENRDKEQLESFHHQIIIYAANSKQRISNLLRGMNNGTDEFSKADIQSALADLLETTEKIITTSRFATSANFRLDSAQIEDDLCLYIEQYLQQICTAYHSRISVRVKNEAGEFISRFTPIELGMVLDNFVNNSKKARASFILFHLKKKSQDFLEIEITDDGKGIDSSIIEPQRIFEKGFTTSRGSGLGLYFSRNQIEKMGGEVFLAKQQPKVGASFIIRLKK